MYSRFSVISRPGTISTEPLSQSGVITERFSGEKMLRTACCSTRLTPNVASSVSSGRAYNVRTMPRSIAMPTSAAIRNAAGIATNSDAPIAFGISCCTT